MAREPTWQDKLEARTILRLGAPVGHDIKPCACRSGQPRPCVGVCEDTVDAIAKSLAARGAFFGYIAGRDADEYDDEIPF